MARALVDAKRFHDAHPDQATFYDARRRALTEAFGSCGAVETERCPEARALAGLMDSTIQQIVGLHSPFADFLEAPENIVDLYQQFAAPITEGIRIARQALEDLLVRVVVTRFEIPEDATINDDDLRANGFDPSAPWPDELGYW